MQLLTATLLFPDAKSSSDISTQPRERTAKHWKYKQAMYTVIQEIFQNVRKIMDLISFNCFGFQFNPFSFFTVISCADNSRLAEKRTKSNICHLSNYKHNKCKAVNSKQAAAKVTPISYWTLASN